MHFTWFSRRDGFSPTRNQILPSPLRGSGQDTVSSWEKTPSLLENHVKCISYPPPPPCMYMSWSSFRQKPKLLDFHSQYAACPGRHSDKNLNCWISIANMLPFKIIDNVEYNRSHRHYFASGITHTVHSWPNDHHNTFTPTIEAKVMICGSIIMIRRVYLRYGGAFLPCAWRSHV